MPRQSTDSSNWIRRFHPAPHAGARLVCLPHAGGSASYYFPVSRALAPGIDVLAVQYPGRQDRRGEPCIDSIPVLADRITAALEDHTDLPLALFGHSMGATLAFEVAVRLQAAGVRATHVFVSGRRAPSTRRVETVHLKPDSALVDEIRELAGTDATLLDDADLLPMVLPPLRADYRAIETYAPSSATVDAPIIALVGDDDPKATHAEVSRWAEHTAGGFELRQYPGGHFYLNEHAGSVIGVVGRKINEARRLLVRT
jgi:surfactin synthase thioesterase subunit